MDQTARLLHWRARLRATPFCDWLGLSLESCDETGVVMRMAVRPEILGNPSTGALHGGILGSLIDTAASYAVMVRTGRSVATIDMRVDFHRAALASEYRIEGAIVKLGRTLATSEARVHAPDGELIASGRAVFLNIDV